MSSIFPTISVPAGVAGSVWVYLLQSADGSLYVGQSSNLTERLRKHRFGLGSKHTQDHREPRLVYCEGPFTLAEAVTREAQLKRWSRAKKEALVRGDGVALRLMARSREMAAGGRGNQ